MLTKRAQTVALIALAIGCTCVRANPDSPTVVHGSATFTQPNANTLNVTTGTNKAIINWQGFSIGAGQTTNFIQPSSNSAVLNRVTGSSPSKIYGNLNSNGQVFLINQHGMMIGPGARINTSGFYGSTLNITNEDFLKGNLKFEGGGFGGIVNKGYIHAGLDGNVVLIAPDIENGGVIEVDNGRVLLAAGKSIRITSLNDSAIEFDVKSGGNDKIINLGDIIAKQGAVRLFADSLTHSGSISANGLVQNADGTISLVANNDIMVAENATLNTDGASGGSISVHSHHGDVIFEGSASAQGSTHHGGRIEILGNRVGLFGSASVDASGKNGGGEVLVGGDFQGQGDTQTAIQTQVGPHAVIRADALESGDGGKVIVWADGYTRFEGEATAKGGADAGDGGFIEISGKNKLTYRGQVDASAANGDGGTVLFDPTNVTFDATSVNTTLLNNPYQFTDDQDTDTDFLPSAITDITDGGTAVEIQADQNITVAPGSDIITIAGGNGGDITFRAGQSIVIQSNIVTDNGNLFLYANDPGSTNRGVGTAVINQVVNTTIDAGTGNVEFWMNSGGIAGNIDLADVTATGGHVLIKHNGLDNGGSILQSGGGTITALSVFIDHDGPFNGTVGSADPALNLVTDNLGAHIHRPTAIGGGIYITAQPLDTGIVTVGNTCYGNGDPGCDTFGSHLVRGLETIEGGGLINLNVAGGNLLVVEPIQVDDVNGTGNPGNISINVSGLIIANSDIINYIGDINLTSSSAVSFFKGGNSGINNGASLGINGGTVTLNSGGGPGSGLLLLNSGTFLEGVGVIDGDVFSQGGIIDIGDDQGNVGTLAITGDLVLDIASIVVFDIVGSVGAGSDYDLLTVSGVNGAAVAGTLVALWDTSTPPAPAIYTLINTVNGTVGIFDTVLGPVGATSAADYNDPNNVRLDISAVSPNINFWTGQGDGSSWENAGNWLNGVPDDQFVDINFDGDIVVTISQNTNPSILGISTQNELSIQGIGQLSVTDPATSLIGDLLSIDSSGGLDFEGDVYLAGLLSWKNGTLSGNGTMTNVMTIASIAELELNNPVASVDIQLTNRGTISKLDAGTATLAGGIDNFGTLLVNSGTLAYVGALNEGIIDVAAGASLTTTNVDLTNLPGATIRGSGTIDVGTATLFNDGTLEPGGVDTIGILTILGNLTLSSSADLQIEIDNTGLVAGIHYDQLVVAGAASTATLDGFLTVSLLNGSPVAGTYRLIDLPDGGTLANGFGIDNLAAAGFGPLSISLNSAEATFGSGGVFWDDGAGDGFWNSAANWSGDVVPLIGDDATIGVFNVTIAAAANANTLSLASGGAVSLVTGGTLTIATSAQLDGDLSISGGTLTGNGAITVNGNLNWTGGGIGGAGLLTTNGFSSWNQGGGLTLSRNWTNGSTGSINWSSGNLAVNTNATFTNDGTLTASGADQSLTLTTGTTFNNRNILNINNGTTTTFRGNGTFTNSGLIDVASATTMDILTSIGTDTGTWNIGPGARIAITGGARTLSGGFSLASTGGDLEIANGTLTVATTSLLTLPSGLGVTVSGGTLTGTQDLTVNGLLTVAGGTLNLAGNLTTNGIFDWTSVTNSTIDGGGSGSLIINGALNITGNNFHSFSGITVSNFGVTSYLATGGSTALRLNDGTTFNNNGLFDIQDNLLVGNISGVAVFNNQAGGELRKSGGTGAATIVTGIAYTNSSASINIQSGSLTVNGGAALTLDSTSVLEGSGTFNGALTNNGTIRPGGTSNVGTLSINGAFINTGIVEIEIDNIAGGPGSGYDELAIIGGNPANLGGNLNLISINGFNVQNGDTLTPVSYGSRSGTFAFTAIGTEIISPTYNAGNLDLLLSFGGLFSFTGLGDGTTWNDAANWNQGLPGIGNAVSIGGNFNVTIAAAANADTLSLASGASLTLTASTLTIASDSTFDGLLAISGGTLDLNGSTLTLNGGLNWSNTSTIFNGTLNLPASATLNITGGASNFLNGIVANVAGSTVYSAGDLRLQDGTTFNNSGVFNFAGNVGINDGGGALSTFNNLNGGLVIKSAGAFSAIDSTLTSTNQGSVDVQTGTLDLNLAVWTLGAGDTFSGSGTYVGSVINNGGIVRPGGQNNRGTLTVLGDFTNNLGTLEIEIDSPITHDVLAVTNTLGYGNVAGSILDISLISFIPTVAETHDVITCVTSCDTTTPFGTINQPGGVTHSVNYNANNLNLTVTSVSFFWDGGGALDNWFDPLNWSLNVLPNVGTDVVLAGGDNVIFDGGLATIASLTLNTGSSLNLASGTLTNAGLLTVNGGATLAIGGGTLDNGGNANFNGIFAMTSGVTTFRGNSVFNGNYTHSGGTATFTGTAAFNGPNTHSGGTTNFNGASNFAGTTLVSGGTLNFNAVGTMQNLNNSWSGGVISGIDALVLGSSPGDTTLALIGPAVKTLDSITLDANGNTINMSGSGNLLLSGAATIINDSNNSFNHTGNGSIVGVGTFDNSGGTLNKSAGAGTIAVDLINDSSSIINVSNGTLVINDAGANDAGTYNANIGGVLVFAQDRQLVGALKLNGGTAIAGPLAVTPSSPTTLTLPTNLVFNGALLLNNAILDLSSQADNTLVMNAAATLGGRGRVQGNVNNIAGVVTAGGNNSLGNLEISGAYKQGANAAIVISVLNDGVETQTSLLTINGPAQLNGGTLLIGYLDASLGATTSDFIPIQFRGGVSGQFGQSLDAGGITLLVEYAANALKVLGTTIEIPQSIIDDLLRFLNNSGFLTKLIGSNRSEAEAMIEELLNESGEGGSLVCN